MSDKEIVLLIGVITFAGIVIWSLVNCGFEWVENHKKTSDDNIKEFQDEWLRDAKIKALEGRMRDIENKVNKLDMSVHNMDVQLGFYSDCLSDAFKKLDRLHDKIKNGGD